MSYGEFTALIALALVVYIAICWLIGGRDPADDES